MGVEHIQASVVQQSSVEIAQLLNVWLIIKVIVHGVLAIHSFVLVLQGHSLISVLRDVVDDEAVLHQGNQVTPTFDVISFVDHSHFRYPFRQDDLSLERSQLRIPNSQDCFSQDHQIVYIFGGYPKCLTDLAVFLEDHDTLVS